MQANDFEYLLHDLEFLRRLARGLTHRDGADDLVQDVRLAAIRNPPSHGANLRGYFATLARRIARGEWKAERRRMAREQWVAQRDAIASESSIVEQLEVRRVLVDALLALREPYRSTIALRYFHDRTPTEIAEATGAPLNTVKTRLKRGLKELRDDLSGRHHDDRGWCSALAAFAASTDRWVMAAPRAVSSAFVGSSVAALSLLVAGLFAPRLLNRSTEVSTSLVAEVTRSGGEPSVQQAGSSSPSLSPSVSIARMEAGSIGAEVPAATREASLLLSGRVVEANGAGVAGATIVVSEFGFDGGRIVGQARSEPDGSFRVLRSADAGAGLACPSNELRVSVWADHFHVTRATLANDGADAVTLVLDRGAKLQLRLIASDETVLDEASVVVSVLDATGERKERTGAVVVPGLALTSLLPKDRLLDVRAHHERYGFGGVALGSIQVATDDVVLDQTLTLGYRMTLAGRAELHDGTPAYRTRVEARRFGRPADVLSGQCAGSAYVDESGRFDIVGLAPGRYRVQPFGSVASDDSVEADAGASDVVLTVGGHSIVIRVRDPDGNPLTSAHILAQRLRDERTPSPEPPRTLLASGDKAVGRLDVSPGEQYAFAATLGDVASRERVAFVPTAPAQTIVDLVVPIARTGTLRVVSRRTDGTPVKGAKVRISSAVGGMPVLEAISLDQLLGKPIVNAGHVLDVDGEVTLPVGTYQVAVDPPGEESGLCAVRLTHAVTIREGLTTEVQVGMHEGGRLLLRGKLARRSDDPIGVAVADCANSSDLQGVVVDLWSLDRDRDASSGRRQALRVVEGHFEWEPLLPPGRYRLRLELTAADSYETDLVVGPGRDCEVDWPWPQSR